MGLEDRLRRKEEADDHSNTLAAQHAAQQAADDERRTAIAGRLLRDLGNETLGVVQKRKLARALEITSISITNVVFGYSVKIGHGKSFWLLQGDAANENLGLTDTGELIRFKEAQHIKWSGMAAHSSHTGIKFAKSKAVAKKLKITAEQHGCALAASEINVITASAGPALPVSVGYGDYVEPNCLFLSADETRLLYGSKRWSIDAEEWVVNQIMNPPTT